MPDRGKAGADLYLHDACDFVSLVVAGFLGEHKLRIGTYLLSCNNLVAGKPRSERLNSAERSCCCYSAARVGPLTCWHQRVH